MDGQGGSGKRGGGKKGKSKKDKGKQVEDKEEEFSSDFFAEYNARLTEEEKLLPAVTVNVRDLDLSDDDDDKIAPSGTDEEKSPRKPPSAPTKNDEKK
ncbi:unnamed protein product [Urochloa humidicola]